MTIGQLWYTWAERGAGGINKLQILAASGRLDDPAHPVTQAVLECCYRPTTRSLAWLQQGRVRIVFHRSLTGTDRWGRPGNYFVHALVGDVDELTPGILARLLNAPLWVTELPDDVPDKLLPITSVEDLDLSPAADLEDDIVRTVLAGYLASVRSFRHLAVDDEPVVVAACAASLTALLPERFGTISFCSDPTDNKVEDYDMVPGDPPTGVFEALVPGQPPSRDGLAAADVIMAAAQGGIRSANIVAAIAELSPSLLDFSEQLQNWCAIDRAPDYGSELSSAELAFIGADKRLVGALLDGPGIVRLAASVANGVRGIVGLVAAAVSAGIAPRLARPVVDELVALDPVVAAGRLRDLAPEALELAIMAATGLIDRWDEDRISALDLDDRATILRLLDGSRHDLPPSADALFDDETARVVFAESGSSTALRVRAVCVRPKAMSTKDLAVALTRDVRLLQEVLHAADADVLAHVGLAVAALDPTTAARVAWTAWDLNLGVAEGWLMEAIGRLDAESQFDQVAKVLKARADVPETESRWGDMLLESLLQSCDASLRQARRLPQTAPAFIALQRVHHPSAQVRQWAGFLDALVQLPRGDTAHRLQAVVKAAEMQFGPELPGTASDLIVEALATTVESSRVWIQCLDLLAEALFRSPVVTLERVVAVAVAPQRYEQARLAAFTILWVQGAVEAGRLREREVADVLTHLDKLLDTRARRWLTMLASPENPGRRSIRDRLFGRRWSRHGDVDPGPVTPHR